MADAYRQADQQVLSKIRFALGLDQVRAAICGTAPVAPEVLEFMHALGIPVTEAWGMSECLIGTINPPAAIRIGTVGTAVPGWELKLADDGELLVRGPTVMRGYHRDPAKTAEALGPRPLAADRRPGRHRPGRVRADHRPQERAVINAAGKNMSPASIEGAVLAASVLIAQVVTIGDRRPHITALIVLDPDAAAVFAARHGIADPGSAALAEHPAVRAAVAAAVQNANGRLSRVEQIKQFAVLPVSWEPGGDELTPTMKLKRQAITAKYADVIESLYTADGQPA